MKIILENVRTFDQRAEFPLTPLTFLVGENSTGKSTLLGMMSALFHSYTFPIEPDFNRMPYSLGTYNTISTYKGGRVGHSPYFAMGYEMPLKGESSILKVMATYVNHEGIPSLDKLDVCVGEGAEKRSLNLKVLDRRSESLQVMATMQSRDQGTDEFQFSVAWNRDIFFAGDPLNLIMSGYYNARRNKAGGAKSYSAEDIETGNRLLSFLSFTQMVPLPFSIAPIRTEPQRLYDQARQYVSPMGVHIPFILDRMLSAREKKMPNDPEDTINRFGKEGGLFEGLSVKHLADDPTYPFELRIKLGRKRNLIDVGYGVSQALPVVVQSAIMEDGHMILMQQPEVHLHPRAQAALGTLFCNVAAVGNRTFVIETHSDFIVDRVRQEVAKGTIPASSVSILFFHREGYESKVYPLNLDDNGNVVNAPHLYREFFLREEMNLFTRNSNG